MSSDEACAACGHDRVFHRIGTGNGVPEGKEFCDDRYADPCGCTGFVARQPIERYVLATVDIPGGQIFAGLAYEEGEALAPMRAALADYASYAAEVMRKKGDKLDEDVAHALTEATRINVEERWPGRAWFVEVWNEREALTQTYAPYGRPRVR